MQNALKKLLMIPIFIFGFILMGLVAGYLTFKIMSFSKTVDMPDLKGKTLVEANELLKKNTLYLKVEGEEYDTVVPSGRIVRQIIPPGDKVKEQRGVSVFLSKGPKVLSVPGLAGMTLHDAEAIIAKTGLKVEKVIHVHSRTIEKDVVIAQRPNPDEAIRDTLSLVVSAGPYDIIYFCPDFSGRSRDDAADLAGKLGLKVEFSGEGEIVGSQKPRPNAQVKSGETIRLHLEGEPLIRG